ncbi:MAG TPA: ATP-binding protein [Solirubrobacteraceae bacterium]|jgi:signal transduction histidine kinase|nr:ATP-binding protein [Solirubrobacteraceae bacterium]
MLRRSLRTQITTRVLTLSATVAVLLGATLILLIIAVTGQRDAGRIAFASQKALTLTSRLETSLFAIENGLRDYVERYPTRPLKPVTTLLKAYPGQQRALAQEVSGDPGQRARVTEIGVKINEYVIRATPLITLAKEDPEAARNQLFYTDTRDRVEALGKDLRDLADRERTLVAQRENHAEAQSTLAIAFGIGGLGLVLLVVAGGTLYLRRAVVRPVVSVAQATGQLAAGDLSTRVPASREDEIGDLARGFNTMADSLERGQAELERSNAELTRSNAELEQFASVTSHDLQAPLTTISMYAELLERRQAAGGEGAADLIDGIRGATRQARTLIRDLLEYSRAGRGDLTLEPQGAEVALDQALEALAGAIEATGAHVRVGSLPVVLADRSNLCRVFQNLVGNAVKFTRGDDPEVSIEARPDGTMWRFDVRDNGIGMDPDSTRRIFEPFRRLHGEDAYAGTGIGLAVCERIVEQHGGRIWVTSEPGAGSVFSFTMPAAQAPGGEPAASAPPPVTAAS